MYDHYGAQVRRQVEDLRQQLSAARATIDGLQRDALKAAARLRATEAERDEARSWARHGYEIGQRHCGWTDHGVAPAWLTDGWPPRTDTCQHLTALGQADAQVGEWQRQAAAAGRRVLELQIAITSLHGQVDAAQEKHRDDGNTIGRLEAKLAELQEGEEPYEDERGVPTPAQWIWKWNRVSPAERLEAAEIVIEARNHQRECFMQKWPARAREAEARIAAVRAALVELEAENGYGGYGDGLWRATSRVRAALDGPAEQPAGHDYLSTGCLHGEHGYCQGSTGAVGAKAPAQCKFCAAPCRCTCHTTADGPS